MNKDWAFYHRVTGEFLPRRFNCPANVTPDAPGGYAVIEGIFDHLSQRIDIERLAQDCAAALERHHANVKAARAALDSRDPDPVMPGRQVFTEPVFEFRASPEHVIDWQPPQPSADHEWSADSRRWVKRADVLEREARQAANETRIAALEVKQGRAVREALLALLPPDHPAREHLQPIEEQIARLRAGLRASDSSADSRRTD